MECRSVDHPTEVVVIDNNADEELSYLVKRQVETSEDSIRYVRQPSPGLSAARHRGADEANGDLLVYLDDDVELSKGWLAGMMKGFADSSAGIVGGPSIPRFTGSVPAWFWDFFLPTPHGGWYCGWVSLLDIGHPVADVDANYIWGLNFGIRRSVLKELGGFNPDTVPPGLQRWQGDGETGLTIKAKAAGTRACYVPEALLYHYVGPDRLTEGYFARRAYFQGVCDSFTKIRAGNAPEQPLSDPPPPPPVPPARPWAEAAAEVRRLIDKAYRDGFEFHQREASNDPRLLQWIRRESFWDADILAEAAAYNMTA
jgi:GT2 family glycosyltransferase